ncbi:MAG: SdrD B-like domain-containing protein [Chitinophagales bacterium]
MITTIRTLCNTIVLLLLFFSSRSQELRSYNQNSARSNHAKALSVFVSPVFSSSTNNSKDSLLFRGNGSGFRAGGDYFFGKAGIGFSTGFSSSSADDAAINSFLKNAAVPPDQMLITKANQQNMYLMVGPSVRFGNKVELYAHAKGGLFINNSGLVSIQQRGASRAAYRNESTDKNMYPGFLTGLSVQYKTKSDVWSFGVGADYMSTTSEVNNYDARRGGGIEALKLSGNIRDVVAGVSIRYHIFSPRDQGSGQSTGRVLPTVNKREVSSSRDASSGLATGKTYQPGKPVYGNITSNEDNNGSCGPVTKKVTNPDGSVEEMSFSCPADAANYASQMKMDGTMPNRISMNVTVPKQTQGTTFGEKVNAGLHAAGGALAQGASMSIISGTLTWGSSGERIGIVTNSTILSGNTSNTKQTNQSSFGTMVRLSARDHASGQATGKRAREKGSGLATGRRQYEAIFAEGQGSVCNPCLATAKMSGANTNPLYNNKAVSGENPFYEGNKRTAGGEDEDCDGIAAADIFLLDASSGAVVAKTKTERCGDFFFANVPEGNYVVKVSGSFIGKKAYDVYLNPKTTKTDLGGAITAADDWDVQLLINTSNGNDEMTEKAGISTSRSNIRTKSLTIIEADLDGDGEYESLKATGTFSDGSTRDITSGARKTISNASGTKGITIGGNAFELTRRRVEVLKSNKQGSPNANRLTSISITTGNRLTATGTFSDGSTRDISEGLAANMDHQGVRQYSIIVSDSDDDGIADAVVKTKTKSNQSNDRMASGGGDDDKGLMNARNKITKSRSNIQNNRMINDEEGNDIWSPRSNFKIMDIATGDVDGDGRADMLIGGAIPGGAVITSAKMQGDPVHGVDVKLGNKSGQALKTVSANEYGEFEFTNLDAGDYSITVEQKLIINDETFISLTGGLAENINTSESNLKGIVEKKSGSTFTGNTTILDSDNDNSSLSEPEAKKPITFRWPQAVPQGGGLVTYRLRVWQLMQGQNGTQAMRSNRPITEKTVTNTTETSVQGILTGPCKPPYLCDFIWSVQAFNKEGKAINDNQVQSFSVGSGGGSSTRAQDHNSSRSNKTASIIANDNDPDDTERPNSVLTESEAKKSITFRWAQTDPQGGGPVTYRLRVWQLMQGQNGTQAMRSNTPITEKTVTNTTETSIEGVLTGPCKPPYLCDFIWSIQAFNKEGKAINDNQVQSFSVGNGGGSSTKAQDHNSSRSNKTASIIANDIDPDDTESPVTKLQNNNTVRSNRTDNALIDNSGSSDDGSTGEGGSPEGKEKSGTMPVKWSAPESMRAAINNSHSNIKNLLASLDQLDQQLNSDNNNAKSIINTSRSNIKNQRMAINNLNQMLENLQLTEKDVAMNELDKRMVAMNMQFLSLQESLTKLGQQYSSISNVLKTRHEVAMNSIRNMK